MIDTSYVLVIFQTQMSVVTQGNAVPPLPIYDLKRSLTSDCCNARERHTTIVTGPNLNVAFPHVLFCTLTTDKRQGHHIVSEQRTS